MNKKLIMVAAMIVVVAVTGWFAAQMLQTSEPSKQETALEHAAKHLDPKYQCPMHPQIIRDEPGNCPICGMNLVPMKQDDTATAEPAEKKILYYRHPHKPEITSDKPMQDEMGMDFVPVYGETTGAEVRISPAVENNMGVRTAKVERNKLWRRIDTVAYVDYDGSKVGHVHPRTDGWIEQLAISSEGERIKKGDRLFNVYSPTLVNAMEEYLQVLRTNNTRLLEASKDRLMALGVAEKLISQLEKNRKVPRNVPLYAPQDGVVSVLNVREGMYVGPEMEVMRLADLSSVWLLADVFEHQADWVRLGQSAEVKLSYLPGKTWEGKVEYIYPSLDPKTRTLKVRLRFENADESLKPNMFAHVSIFGGATDNVLVIPREALIRTGQSERVIVSLGNGRFSPRTVVEGTESGDYVAIIQGLEEGESV
ncbi:MAG: efflux RND transporter periplasmic adaptor subunit, partial [Gammaproteobacteria bacterium]|nr:efflux RND transporter periplasmic adaptor subunit [Gammaproteobacteria bacterium]